jgi:Ca2+-binding RTX toxin-like protein
MSGIHEHSEGHNATAGIGDTATSGLESPLTALDSQGSSMQMSDFDQNMNQALEGDTADSSQEDLFSFLPSGSDGAEGSTDTPAIATDSDTSQSDPSEELSITDGLDEPGDGVDSTSAVDSGQDTDSEAGFFGNATDDTLTDDNASSAGDENVNIDFAALQAAIDDVTEGLQTLVGFLETLSQEDGFSTGVSNAAGDDEVDDRSDISNQDTLADSDTETGEDKGHGHSLGQGSVELESEEDGDQGHSHSGDSGEAEEESPIEAAGLEVIDGKPGQTELTAGINGGTTNAGPDTETITGSDANDFLNGFNKTTSIMGGPGQDVINGGNVDAQLYGEAGDDFVSGGSKVDNIDGGTGNDFMKGGTGADQLTGGEGVDMFGFSRPTEGTDTITDFNAEEDMIGVSNFGFDLGLDDSTLASNPEGIALPTEMFTIGSEATNASQYFIYNPEEGSLSYDQDGNGTLASVKLAQFSDDLDLTNEEIRVFS